MRYIVIDTETTGLPDWKRPADAEGQPRVASFAMLALDHIDDDPVSFERYIRPDGWSMSPEAGRVNGLTDEFLMERGVPVSEVLDEYERRVRDGYVVVAFNAQFDAKMMRAEMRRAGRDDLFGRTQNICVMRPLTNIMRLPGRHGLKWPNLSEACSHCGVENRGAHQAIGDAEAALGVMRWLHRAGALPEPAVHLAKARAS